MSKQCKVCNSISEDKNLYCPVCGAPFTDAVQPAPQSIQQPIPQVAPQSMQQPIPQVAPQSMQQPIPQVAPQSMQQPIPQTAPDSKGKSKKTVFIVLGIVGGVLILLIASIIVAFMLVNRIQMSQHNLNSSGNTYGNTYDNTSSHEWHDSSNQEYYYPSYDNSDLNSEDYIIHSTEQP